MCRVAVLADIHGNVPALDAVVADIALQDVDEVLVAGDLVGRGPQGSAVVQRVRRLGWRCIQGNHEDFLLTLRNGSPRVDRETPLDLTCHQWMAAELTDEDAAFLRALPLTMASSVAPDVRIVHGSPTSFHEGLGPWTPEDVLRRHLAAMDETVLVGAHTHRPMVRAMEDGCVVNTGAVGLPFDGDWHARYAILGRDDGHWDVEHRRVPWDRARFLEIYESSGFLESGGLSAELLRMEVMTARSHLVPFLVWAKETGRPEDRDSLRSFAARFDPVRGLDDLMARAREDGGPADAA